MNILERLRLIKLFNLYQNLLTAKQKEIFTSYYFYDLSLSEISEMNKSSRSFVQAELKRVKDKLEDYENKLKLEEKLQKIENLDLKKEEKAQVLAILERGEDYGL